MRRIVMLALVGSLGTIGFGCSDDSAATDAGDVQDQAPEDAATPDEAAVEDAGADEIEEAGDVLTCPEVTPEDVVLTRESAATIQIIAGEADTQLSAGICTYTPPLAWATRLGEALGCRVLHWLPVTAPPTGSDLETGDITIELDGEAFLLPPASPTAPCARTPLGSLPVLEPGDTVRAWSTGGTDVAAFDLTVTVPELPALETPAEGDTLTACAPWRFSWTPDDAPGVYLGLYEVLGGVTFRISCRDLSASPFEIPADLTALWASEADGGMLTFGVTATAASTTDPVVTLEVSRQMEPATVAVDRP